MPGFLQRMREESIDALTAVERRELGPLLAPRGEAEPLPAPRPVVQRWQLADLEGLLDQTPRGRDFARGRSLFQQALCARCHRLGGTGRAVGPELTAVGSRFSRRDILESVMSPSKVVAEKYRLVEVLTTDGRRITGQPLDAGDYRSPTLRLVTDPLKPAEVVELPKRDISRRRVSLTSAMPSGLLDSLTRDEILDLLAFLQSGGNPRHPAFQ